MWCFLVYSRTFVAPFAMSRAFKYQEIVTYIYSEAAHSLALSYMNRRFDNLLSNERKSGQFRAIKLDSWLRQT